MLIGLGAWVIATIVVLLFLTPLSHPANSWLLWTCMVGIVLGLVGLAYAAKRHK